MKQSYVTVQHYVATGTSKGKIKCTNSPSPWQKTVKHINAVTHITWVMPIVVTLPTFNN